MPDVMDDSSDPQQRLDALLDGPRPGSFADRRQQVLELLDEIYAVDGPEPALSALYRCRRLMSIDQTLRAALNLRFTAWYREVPSDRLVAAAPPLQPQVAIDEAAHRSPETFAAVAEGLDALAEQTSNWRLTVHVFLARARRSGRSMATTIVESAALQSRIPNREREAHSVLARGITNAVAAFTPDRETLDDVIAVVTRAASHTREMTRALAELRIMGGRLAVQDRDTDGAEHYLAPVIAEGEPEARTTAAILLGGALALAERFADVEAYLAPVLSRGSIDGPTRRHLQELRGIAQFGAGNAEAALATLRRAYEKLTILDAIDIHAMSLYGVLELERGNYEQAEWAADRARMERPMRPVSGPRGAGPELAR